MSTTTRSGLGGSALYAVVATGLEKVVALGIALYLPRHLGLADYGHYAFLLAYLSLFQVMPDAGLEAVLVARLARAGGDVLALAGRGALVRLALSVAGAVVGLPLLVVVAGDATLVPAGLVTAGGLVASAATPYRALLRARLRMTRFLLLLGAEGAVAVALLALVVRAGGGLVPVLAAVGAAAVAGLAFGRLLVGPGARLRPDMRLARALVAEAWPLAGTTLSLVAAQQVLQILLLRLHGAGEVGLFGASQKLVEAVGLLPRALMLSVLPAMALAAGTAGGATAAARDAARLLVVVLLPPTLALVLWAEPLLGRGFGPAFGAGAPVLAVLAPAALLGATGSVLTSLLVVLGLQRLLFRVTAGAAVAKVVVGVLLVPRYGAVGAAEALVVTMLGGQVALLALRPVRAHVAPVLAGVVWPVALGALAGAAVASLGRPLLGGIGVLVLAYPVALLATGTVTRADLARWRR
jgi:O-antigen/teichoic acid export membrane protein